jgi:hypothetical protein
MFSLLDGLLLVKCTQICSQSALVYVGQAVPESFEVFACVGLKANVWPSQWLVGLAVLRGNV